MSDAPERHGPDDELPGGSRGAADGAARQGASLAGSGDGDDHDAVLLAHKMALIGSLVPGLIHDLSNPLSAIKAFSQLLAHDPRLPDDLRGDAELLVEAAERARQLAIGTLEFARTRPPERHPTPLGPLVRSVVDLGAYALSRAQVAARIDLPPDLPLVPLDRGQMQQVLLELTLAAIGREEARADGGTLAFTAAVLPPPPARVALRLARDRAVGPADGTNTPDVVTWIVAEHDGHLRTEQTDGGGTTWIIELPLAAPA